MLNKSIFFVCLFSVTVSFGYAQSLENKIALGLNFVKNEYNGDYGSGILNFNEKNFFTAIGISLTKYMTPSIDAGLQGSFGSYGFFETKENRFIGLKYDGSLFVHYKLNNGYIFKENSKLSPFISFGLGMAAYGINRTDSSSIIVTYSPTIITNRNDIILPLGIGFKYQLTNLFAIQYQYLYTFTTADNHDNNRSATFNPKPGNDAYGQHLIGFIYTFNNSYKNNDCRCNF